MRIHVGPPRLVRSRLHLARTALAATLLTLACGGESAQRDEAPSLPDASPSLPAAGGATIHSMTPERGPPGSMVTIEASGLPLAADVEIGFGAPNSNFEIVAQARSDAAGNVSASVTVPVWAEPGRGYMFVIAPLNQPPRAASDTFHVVAADSADAGVPPDEIVRLEGTLTDEGVECPAMRSLEDKLYTLLDVPEGFRPGEHVYVEGTLVQISMCMQGVTLAVLKIERR